MWKQKSAYEQIQNTFFAASRKAWKRKDTNKFWLTWVFQDGQNQRRLQVKLSAVLPPCQRWIQHRNTAHPSPHLLPPALFLEYCHDPFCIFHICFFSGWEAVWISHHHWKVNYSPDQNPGHFISTSGFAIASGLVLTAEIQSLNHNSFFVLLPSLNEGTKSCLWKIPHQ